jgi:CheY-like chemotaxis protein
MTKILVAEDEKIIGLDLKRTLLRFGHEVTSIVGTGLDVIEKAELEHPDLILMDIKLKGLLDGIEASKIISFKHKIPIIFVTALNNKETIQRIKGSGAFGFLLKPFNDQTLHDEVQRAIEAHQSEFIPSERSIS